MTDKKIITEPDAPEVKRINTLLKEAEGNFLRQVGNINILFNKARKLATKSYYP